MLKWTDFTFQQNRQQSKVYVYTYIHFNFQGS